jgi:uncharacterized repeat protein (TIGR01451 family)
VRPIDPNDKVAPHGVGDEHLVAAADELEYMIRFENFTSASAPVQELTVVDYIDPNLDWSTVRFGAVAYGDRMTNVPNGVLSFSGCDIPPTNSIAITGHTVSNMAIDISAVFNAQNGRLEWRMKATDTGTGLAPYDALAGFLPPNDTNTHCGEGYVRFYVKPKAGTPIGTRIENKASIVFDTNDPIDTPTVFNTIGQIASHIAMQMAYLAGELTLGNRFSYTITLNNSAINVASNLVVTNALPAGFNLISATANVGTLMTNGNQIVWTIGNLTNGVNARLTVTVLPIHEGEFTPDVHVVASDGIARDFKPVIAIGPPRIGIRRAGGSLELHWPGCASSYRLESSARLVPSAAWGSVTNVPVRVGDERVLPCTEARGRMFFRLSRP